ncbi:MAG: TonB-dependent receptor plug domain-containing protein, partial [Burkholderiales bacterium]|nr:TonB-dependent receptor plug domain-containing protein [Burkholderiales bacterium]
MKQQLKQQTKHPLARAVAGAIVLMGSCQLAASAADTAEATQSNLGNITVLGEADSIAKRSSVGSKNETALIEVPQSISVLNRERLDAQKASSIPQALRYSAGMQVESYGVDPRFDQYMIRGFESGSNGVFRDALNLPTRG